MMESVNTEDENQRSADDMEEYYRKLNESLKLKTASLISQAEKALQNQLISDAGERTADPSNTCDDVLEDDTADFNTLSIADSDEAASEVELEEGGDVKKPSSSKTDARLRVMRAKLASTSLQLQRASGRLQTVRAENSQLLVRLKKTEVEGQELRRLVTRQDGQLERLRASSERADQQLQTSRGESAALRRSCEAAERELKTAETRGQQAEVRQTRAGEEAQRLRQMLEAEKTRARELIAGLQEKNTRLEGEGRRQERERQQLLVGFKKLMKLVEVLKQQNVHLRASKMLQVAGDDFAKLLLQQGITNDA